MKLVEKNSRVKIVEKICYQSLRVFHSRFIIGNFYMHNFKRKMDFLTVSVLCVF